MTEVPKHDWQQIIGELEASGLTLYKLSTMIGKQLHQVQRLKKPGRQPKHFDGERLLEIYREWCPKEHHTNV